MKQRQRFLFASAFADAQHILMFYARPPAGASGKPSVPAWLLSLVWLALFLACTVAAHRRARDLSAVDPAADIYRRRVLLQQAEVRDANSLCKQLLGHSVTQVEAELFAAYPNMTAARVDLAPPCGHDALVPVYDRVFRYYHDERTSMEFRFLFQLSHRIREFDPNTPEAWLIDCDVSSAPPPVPPASGIATRVANFEARARSVQTAAFVGGGSLLGLSLLLPRLRRSLAAFATPLVVAGAFAFVSQAREGRSFLATHLRGLYWISALLLLSAALWLLVELPTIRLPRRRRFDRIRPPLCRSCGYDLTGMPDSSLCPECGKPTGRATAEQAAQLARVTARLTRHGHA